MILYTKTDIPFSKADYKSTSYRLAVGRDRKIYYQAKSTSYKLALARDALELSERKMGSKYKLHRT